MPASGDWVTVGIDNGGTANNGTVLAAEGTFLISEMAELPSLVREGPDKAIAALVDSFDKVLAMTGVSRERVRAVGLDTPGPASADGVLVTGGATNFGHPDWSRFNIRAALEERLGIPVLYNNDGNAAALYAHHVRHGADAEARSSVSAIVGTGFGGGVINDGRIVKGATGMAGELGHMPIPTAGLLEDDQPVPSCNCGQFGDAESIASLTGITRNLLPYWLIRFPGHELAQVDIAKAAKLVRGYAERGDEMALAIFRQQAMAMGRVFSIAAKFTDPDTYFVGGGVIEAAPHFRDWFVDTVKENTEFYPEQAAIAEITLVPDLDMAGARGSAIAAAAWVRSL
jgi:predicted NBD/HSP70 family sugar kinase